MGAGVTSPEDRILDAFAEARAGLREIDRRRRRAERERDAREQFGDTATRHAFALAADAQPRLLMPPHDGEPADARDVTAESLWRMGLATERGAEVWDESVVRRVLRR